MSKCSSEKGQSNKRKELSPVMEENGKQVETERASSMSPAHGTQEPPVDISSQEEVEGKKDSNVKNNQINWDALIQEEDATDVQKSRLRKLL
jgi:hypothetical protein